MLDTSILVHSAAPAHLPDVAAAISVASLSELHFGVLVARDSAERARRLRQLALVENRFEALPVRATTARVHGEMLAYCHQEGRPSRRRSMDLLIAATAAENGATLLTLDRDGFRGLESFLTVLHPDDLERS